LFVKISKSINKIWLDIIASSSQKLFTIQGVGIMSVMHVQKMTNTLGFL
jgi:cysteine sulfinate desulfinase/cysteine desulfurase-like protein